MRPFIFITVGYIVGIIWGLYLKLSIVPIFFCCLEIFFIVRKKYKYYILIFILFAIISNIQIKYLEPRFNSLPEKIERVDIIGTVIELKGESEYSKSYVIKIDKSNSKYLEPNMNLNIYTSKDIELEYGDQIEFTGKYEIPSKATNYKQFDYRENLKGENIYGVIRDITNLKVVKQNNLSQVSLFINNLRLRIKQNLLNLLRRRRRNSYRNSYSETPKRFQIK